MSGEWVLNPEGDIDLARTEQLRAEWYAEIDKHRPERLVIDLAVVPFMDSSGLSVLAGVTRRQRRHGGIVAVRNASPLIVRVIQISRISEVVEILPADAEDESARLST